jgi:hypothetical protein
VALMTAITAMLMMLAIGGAATLSTMTETTIAANHRDAMQALYAAEAGIELSTSLLRTASDWSAAAPAAAGTTVVQGALADLLQISTVDPRLTVTAAVFPGPNGAPDVVIVQSTASGAAGIRRRIQVTLRRAAPAEGATTRKIETISWRER